MDHRAFKFEEGSLKICSIGHSVESRGRTFARTGLKRVAKRNECWAFNQAPSNYSTLALATGTIYGTRSCIDARVPRSARQRPLSAPFSWPSLALTEFGVLAHKRLAFAGRDVELPAQVLPEGDQAVKPRDRRVGDVEEDTVEPVHVRGRFLGLLELPPEVLFLCAKVKAAGEAREVLLEPIGRRRDGDGTCKTVECDIEGPELAGVAGEEHLNDGGLAR